MASAPDPTISEGQLRRLAEELTEEGVPVLMGAADETAVLMELAYALRPRTHEGRIPSYGAIIVPGGTEREWSEAIGVPCRLVDVAELTPAESRVFADGISTWVLRCPGSVDNIITFDRSIAEEYVLVSLQATAGGTIVQRHPGGQVRAFGSAGVVRHDGISWYHEPPATSWLTGLDAVPDDRVMTRLLRFAVHDLGARRLGAILICRPEDADPPGGWDERLPHPPPLSIMAAGELAAFRHAISQVDGASIVDHSGAVRHLGVRLVPSLEAEATVPGLRGTRHTSALRYSYDDPDAVVIVISDEGPVTVMRSGRVIGRAAERVCHFEPPASTTEGFALDVG